MSDVKKGLPVRTQQDPDERLQTKIVDFTTPGQGQTVDTDGNAHVEIHGNEVGTGNDKVIVLSEEGKNMLNGVYNVATNTEPSNVGVILHARAGTSALPGAADQIRRVTAVIYDNGVDETVVAQDVAIRDENGIPYSKDNPLSVTVEESPGDEIHDYLQSVDVTAAGGTNQHTFVVNDGETFLLEQILADASSAFKMTLEIGDGAASEAFTTKAVRFASEVNDNADVELKRAIKVIGTANGTTVRVTVENRDEEDDQCIFTTIIGVLFS